MAEIAAAAVCALIPKLVALMQEEHNLQNQARREINLLIKELEPLRASLLDASEMGEEHHLRSADDYLRKLLEQSYDMEDCVDQFMLRAPPKPAAAGLIDMCKGLLAELKASHQMGKKLHGLKSQTKELSEQLRKHKIKSSDAATTSSAKKDPSLPRLQADASSLLVSIDRPRDELIAKLQLVEEEPEWAERLKVISIVGIGGIGKTTLAKQVYEKTQASFACRAWVPVSRNPNMENLLVGILRQVEDPSKRKRPSHGDRLGLIRWIKRSLQGKRYLIVLDDIWSTRTWELIKSALPQDSFGRVITTTRNRDVAKSCCSDWNGYIHNVSPLSLDNSWRLFRNRIIGSAGSFPSHSVHVSEKILQRCSGVPLAIVAVSGLLANKSFWEWEDVCRKTSTTSHGIDEMRNLLLLSYYDLPHHLKMCFLHLSIFMEDLPINCDHVIRCWIAEGFVSQNPKEEIGESYLNELINRGMIQPVGAISDGKPESFRIHSLMLDLIKYILAKHNFVTLLSNEEPPSVSHRKIRRLSITNINEDRHIPASLDISHIRSLHIFGSVGVKLTNKHLSLLRVLDLEGCKDLKDHTIDEIPGSSSLRYLSIRDTPIGQLPDEVEQQLQGIQLDSGCYLNSIPEWFISLPKLTYASIDIKEVKNEDLQLLSKLNSLLHLSLLSKIVPTRKLVIGSDGFHVLRVFQLYSARANLTFQPQAMQKLESLLLSIHVPPEEMFGFSIGQFKSLKKMDIRIIGKGAYARSLSKAARKAADEHPKHPMVNIIVMGNSMDHAAREGKEKEKGMALKQVK
ncbi:hypothetical protein BS78_K286500 [Paspalum vaginatum]|uniref:NB-ARC domain-containing protein n=1 Tax=Paspalum vaginatum TaxID=158149 RepID=A0A9W8CGG7_9POAL|nr:hypothetical protein BS78_K286500 [Paspalum vaginatum]